MHAPTDVGLSEDSILEILWILGGSLLIIVVALLIVVVPLLIVGVALLSSGLLPGSFLSGGLLPSGLLPSSFLSGGLLPGSFLLALLSCLNFPLSSPIRTTQLS